MLLHSLLLATAVAGQTTTGAATTPQQSPSERRTEPAQSQSSSAVDALLTRIDAATESGRVYHREQLLQQLYRVAPRHPKTLSLRIAESLSASDKAQAQASQQQTRRKQTLVKHGVILADAARTRGRVRAGRAVTESGRTRQPGFCTRQRARGRRPRAQHR